MNIKSLDLAMCIYFECEGMRKHVDSLIEVGDDRLTTLVTVARAISEGCYIPPPGPNLNDNERLFLEVFTDLVLKRMAEVDDTVRPCEGSDFSAVVLANLLIELYSLPTPRWHRVNGEICITGVVEVDHPLVKAVDELRESETQTVVVHELQELAHELAQVYQDSEKEGANGDLGEYPVRDRVK